MFSQVCNHYYITLFITITSDVLIKIFKNLIIFLVCGFQGTYLTDILSVIRTLNVFKTLITGKNQFYLMYYFSFFRFGGHLLSHTVSSAVPSAACVLTIVFGMGTGVSHKRIATRKIIQAFDSFDNSTINNNPYFFPLERR